MKLIRYIIGISYLLCITCFLISCLKNPKKGLWLVFVYLLCSLAFDFIHQFSSEDTNILNGVFTIFEFAVFAYFFNLIINIPLAKRVMSFTSIIVLTILIILFIRANKRNFDSFSASLESVIIIIYCLIFFFEQISKPQTYFLYTLPYFWIVLGILIYMASTLFLFILAGNLSDEEFRKYWIINSISNIISNIIFGIGFLMNRFTVHNSISDQSQNPNDILKSP